MLNFAFDGEKGKLVHQPGVRWYHLPSSKHVEGPANLHKIEKKQR